ncbi:hypothetical protein BC828DRAFT_384289 [Blastocladiella britannica]|nr:hypothetical protein BC828DRAFT_384289 [Blastocladiella britannica]
MLQAHSTRRTAPPSMFAVVPLTLAPSSEGAATARRDDMWSQFASALHATWAAPAPPPSGSAPPTTPSSPMPLTIRNKYYAADVVAERCDRADQLADVLDGTGRRAEAVCLLLDTASCRHGSAPIQQLLAPWHRAVAALDAPLDLECLLMISMDTDGESLSVDGGDGGHSEWDLAEVAMAASCELVHWYATEGEDKWDRVGIARVLEALESTMWRSMEQTHLGGAAGGILDDDDDTDADDADDPDAEEDDDGSDLDDLIGGAMGMANGRGRSLRDEPAAAAAADSPAGYGDAEYVEDWEPDFDTYFSSSRATDTPRSPLGAVPAVGSVLVAAAASSNTTSSSSPKPRPAMTKPSPYAAILGDTTADNDADGGEGDATDSLLAMLTEMSRIRDSGAEAGDAKRREMAERAAMRMWAALGGGGDGDDSDS